MREIKFNRTDFIAVYEDVYNKEQCQELIKYIDLLEDRALITNESNNKHLLDHKTKNLAYTYDLPVWSWLVDNIHPGIKGCVNHYLKEFSVMNRNKFLFLDFKVKKIPIGGGFHNWHFEDNGLNNANRYLAVQIYLNDGFEGGETEFLYFNKRVKPVEGNITIFPCAFTHTHRGNPPIGGDKYLATSWGLIQNSPSSY